MTTDQILQLIMHFIGPIIALIEQIIDAVDAGNVSEAKAAKLAEANAHFAAFQQAISDAGAMQ